MTSSGVFLYNRVNTSKNKWGNNKYEIYRGQERFI